MPAPRFGPIPQNNKTIRQFKGLQLAFDPRDVPEPHVIDGSNFLVDTKSVYSAFSTRIVGYIPLTDPTLVQSFDINGVDYIFVKGAVFIYNDTDQTFILQFTFTDDGTKWPWTMAYVGTKYYFCRKGVGVIQYNPTSNIWALLTSFIPTNPNAVAASVSRLIIIGDDKVVWSAIDNGSDLTPSLVTGAGFQGLSLIGGTGISLKSCADGFYAFTTNGWFKGEYNFIFSSATSPFRCYPLPQSLGYKLVSPWCIVSLGDDDFAFLDKKGLFSISQNKVQPFQLAFSEYVFKFLLPNVDLKNNLAIRLSYSDIDKIFYFSVSDAIAPGFFVYAFAIYLTTGEVGRFDRQHWGFLELNFTGDNHNEQLCYIDQEGYIRRFTDLPIMERSPKDDQVNWASDILHNELYVNPTPYYDLQSPTVLRGVSLIHLTGDLPPYLYAAPAGNYILNSQSMSTEPAVPAPASLPDNESFLDYEDYMLEAGTDDYMADPDTIEDWGLVPDVYHGKSSIDGGFGGELITYPAPYYSTVDPLNSYVNIGLFRWTTGQFNDETSLVTNITLGLDPNPSNAVFDDYMDAIYSPDLIEDYNTAANSTEDWGSFNVPPMIFDTVIYASNDNGDTIFMQETPTVAKVDGNSTFLTCTNNGINHFLQLSALSVNESFRLNFLELTANITGRLN